MPTLHQIWTSAKTFFACVFAVLSVAGISEDIQTWSSWIKLFAEYANQDMARWAFLLLALALFASMLPWKAILLPIFRRKNTEAHSKSVIAEQSPCVSFNAASYQFAGISLDEDSQISSISSRGVLTGIVGDRVEEYLNNFQFIYACTLHNRSDHVLLRVRIHLKIRRQEAMGDLSPNSDSRELTFLNQTLEPHTSRTLFLVSAYEYQVRMDVSDHITAEILGDMSGRKQIPLQFESDMAPIMLFPGRK